MGNYLDTHGKRRPAAMASFLMAVRVYGLSELGEDDNVLGSVSQELLGHPW